MDIRQIADPTPDEFAQILMLYREIDKRECTTADYLQYINLYWDSIGMFVVENEGKIVGFLHCEKPCLLSPRVGWIVMAYNSPENGHQTAEDCLRAAEDWFRQSGATTRRMQTQRKARGFKKAFGCNLSEYTLMDKDLTNG